MLKKILTLMLAFGLMFWIGESQDADARHAKRGFGRTSFIGATSKHRIKKSRRMRNARRARAISPNAIRISINIGSQRMVVTQGARQIAVWPISSGRKGFLTPHGRYRVKRMHKTYYSRKYDNAPMPHAMFFRGGYAIHGTYNVRSLGRPASHGCVRLHPNNAAKLFNLVYRFGGVVSIGG
jgi:lipoprotein-anchoring transpeptidase ErfK/SrfK